MRKRLQMLRRNTRPERRLHRKKQKISIIENAGLMGLPIPAAITKAVDILKQRSETEQKG